MKIKAKSGESRSRDEGCRKLAGASTWAKRTVTMKEEDITIGGIYTVKGTDR